VVTIDDVLHGKPAPDTFLVAAQRLGVKPGDCVVLGDSVLDVEGAKAAGMAWVKLEPK
jgi:sugar-phosphatase